MLKTKVIISIRPRWPLSHIINTISVPTTPGHAHSHQVQHKSPQEKRTLDYSTPNNSKYWIQPKIHVSSNLFFIKSFSLVFQLTYPHWLRAIILQQFAWFSPIFSLTLSLHTLSLSVALMHLARASFLTFSNLPAFCDTSAQPEPPGKHLGSWSASTSPARSPSPTRYGVHHGGHPRRRNPLQNPTYGTTSLCQRSRSPSPARLQEMRERDRLGTDEMGTILKLILSITISQSFVTLFSVRECVLVALANDGL